MYKQTFCNDLSVLNPFVIVLFSFWRIIQRIHKPLKHELLKIYVSLQNVVLKVICWIYWNQRKHITYLISSFDSEYQTYCWCSRFLFGVHFFKSFLFIYGFHFFHGIWIAFANVGCSRHIADWYLNPSNLLNYSLGLSTFYLWSRLYWWNWEKRKS